jgi:uncharacterized protein YdcH (DUF465 family)
MPKYRDYSHCRPDGLSSLLNQYISQHELVHREEATARMAALASMDKRLDGLNELRGMASDIAARAVPRDVYDQRHEELDRRIQMIERDMVRQSALDVQETELRRTRNTMKNTIVAGLILVLVNVATFVATWITHR